MVRDTNTLATKEQFLASLPARETDTVHYRTTDGWVVVARVTHSIELMRTYEGSDAAPLDDAMSQLSEESRQRWRP